MKKQKIGIILIIIFLFAMFFSSKSISGNKLIISNQDREYFNIINKEYEEINVFQSEIDTAMNEFKNKNSALIYSNQANLLIESNSAYSFEPQFIQTVVILINKEKTNEEITSFQDILNSDLEINFNLSATPTNRLWELSKSHHIFLSMANALYSEYDEDKLAQDIKKIIEDERYFINDFSKPISITYDSVAVNLIKSGGNYEIIIPTDGTISLEVGILRYKDDILLDDNINQHLINSGYRLIDKSCDTEFYPLESEYEKATLIENEEDITEYNEAAALVAKTIRRQSFNDRITGFTNVKEIAVGYIIMLVISVIYLISIFNRVSSIRVRKSLIYACFLGIIFITLGFLKLTNTNNPFLETTLWYLYYLPLIMITATFVYIAINSGYVKDKKKIDKYYRIYFFIALFMLGLVFTNELHTLVFNISNYYHSYFTYDIGYYFVFSFIGLSVVFSISVLIYKGITSPKKAAFIYPLCAVGLILLYAILVVMKIDAIKDMDLTFSVNILMMILIESCLQSSLVQTNKKHDILFKNSSLAMEIRDVKENVFAKSNIGNNLDENYILKQTPIEQGTFYYYEDYTSLNMAKEDLRKANFELLENNNFLKRKAKVDTELSTLRAQREAFNNIDIVLNDKTDKISQFLDKLNTHSNAKKIMSIINIVVCTVKRECMLLINLLYEKEQSINSLINYISEMQEFTQPIDLKITIGCLLKQNIKTKDSLAIYRLFSFIIEKSAWENCSNIIVHIYEKEENIYCTFTPDKIIIEKSDLKEFKNSDILIKPWDETQAIILKLKKEDIK